jgi:hypothetical protein
MYSNELAGPGDHFARLAGLSRAITRALHSLRERTHPSEGGSVRVAVAPNGAFLGAEVAGGWRVEAHDLGLAALIQDTYALACAAQAAELTTALKETSPVPTDGADLPEPDARPVGMADREADARLASIPTEGGSLATIMDELVEQMTVAFTAHHHGTSFAEHVSVVVDGQGYLAELAFDERWLAQASVSGINTNLAAALARARETLPPDPLATVLDDSRLGRMMRDLTTL